MHSRSQTGSVVVCEEILHFHLKNEFSKMFLYDLFSNIPLVKATPNLEKIILEVLKGKKELSFRFLKLGNSNVLQINLVVSRIVTVFTDQVETRS